jgi:hypothetical protein
VKNLVLNIETLASDVRQEGLKRKRGAVQELSKIFAGSATDASRKLESTQESFEALRIGKERIAARGAKELKHVAPVRPSANGDLKICRQDEQFTLLQMIQCFEHDLNQRR